MVNSTVFHKKRDYHRWTENPFSVLWQVPRKDSRHSDESSIQGKEA